MFNSRSPASRTASSRPYFIALLHVQQVAAEVVCEAIRIEAERIVLILLTAQIVCEARRLLRAPMKVVKGQIAVAGTVTRETSKTFMAAVEIAGSTIRQLSLSRTLTAIVEIEGRVGKQIFQTIKAVVDTLARRLRIEHERGWEFTGTFAPGQRIRVDRERLEVTRDGTNVIDLVDGEIPFFEPGTNLLQYTDEDTARSIRIRILYRGRWL